MTLASYVLAAMLSWSPLADHLYQEPAAVASARYQSIAQDIADVAESEEPLFAGSDGRARTAVLLAAVASLESGNFDVKVQSCTRAGDHGRALGLWQTHTSWAESCTTVRQAAQVALARMRASFVSCEREDPAVWLSEYASGRCDHGHTAARTRWRRAADWLRSHPWGPS